MIRQLLVATAATSLFGACSSLDYAGEVKQALRSAYGSKLPKYTFRSTPVGHFGVGTMYSIDVEHSRNPDENWLVASPSSWFAKGVLPQEQDVLRQGIIEEGSLGDVEINSEVSTSLQLELVLPRIKEVLDLDASVSLQHGVEVKLRVQGARNRRLNWGAFKDAITAGKISQGVRESIADRRVVMGAADIVLGGYSATVKIDETVNPKLNAGIKAKVGQVLTDGAGLDLEIASATEGTFVITSRTPVVAAVLYLRPPPVVPQARPRGALDFELFEGSVVHVNPAVIEGLLAMHARENE